jgi:ribosomal protein L16/L10AE
MRMGKGKGSKKKKIFLINQGDIFIEIKISSLRSLKDFKLFLKVIKKKLSIYIQSCYEKSLYLSL